MAYKPVEITCKNCGTSFKGEPGRKYCGYKCAKKARESKKEMNCLNCEEKFIVQSYRDAKYCSRKCKHEYNSNPIIQKPCSNCGKIIDRKSQRFRGEHQFCSKECSDKFLSGKNHYEWKPELHKEHEAGLLKRWARSIKKRDNYKCKKCGESERRLLEAHHIKPRKDFPDLKFEMNNGITLCLNCHIKEHEHNPLIVKLISSKIKKINGLTKHSGI